MTGWKLAALAIGAALMGRSGHSVPVVALGVAFLFNALEDL